MLGRSILDSLFSMSQLKGHVPGGLYCLGLFLVDSAVAFVLHLVRSCQTQSAEGGLFLLECGDHRPIAGAIRSK